MFLVTCGTIIVLVALTKVTATDEQCTEYQFKAPYFPGGSCQDIYNMNPESRDRSGYYWLIDSNGPSNVYCGMNYTGISCEGILINNPETSEYSGYYRINDTQFIFCNMIEIAANAGFISTCAGMGGGWRRIISIDISEGDNCPSGWRKANNSDFSFCRVDTNDTDIQVCSSASFSTNGISYQNVCGRARGYQKGITFAFLPSTGVGQSLETPYVSGLSITYGNPRQHIWTYATGRYDHLISFRQNSTETMFTCPCANVGGRSGPSAPSYVGANYYCESGAENRVDSDDYLFDDALWDGSGCINSNCCSNSPNQPWFYQQLNASTLEDIEARICSISSFASSSTLIDQLEIYIQ